MTCLSLQRLASTVACASIVLPGFLMAGCGSGSAPSAATAPPIDASGGGYVPQQAAPPKQGMSTGKKVAILAGAAALYYMYKRSQDKRKADPQTNAPQYYLSKNGRIYYRQPNGQAVWVTPPPQGIQVPYAEAQEYSGFQGYENNQSGRTLQDVYNQGGYQPDPRGAYSGGGY